MDSEIFVYDADTYEKDIQGAYRTAAFDIYLSGQFSSDVSKLSKSDLGTFVHEYIHFLQNVSTPWGIHAGIVRNNDIAEMVHSYDNVQEIHFPYHFTVSSLQLEYRKWLQCSIGTGRSSLRIDTSRPTGFYFTNVPDMPISMHNVHFHFFAEDGQKHDIIIGATIIKESMALMIQSFVDPNIHEHPDIPYNVSEILCRNHFANIANDKQKIVQLCYISLFSLDPGFALMCELKNANLHPELSGSALYSDFMSGDVVIRGIGRLSKAQHFRQLLGNYRQSIRGILPCDLHYIGYVLNEVERVILMPPLMGIVELIQNNPKAIQDLIGWLGMPYVHTSDGTQFYLQRSDDEHFFEDVVVMSGNASIYDYICQTIPNATCPFSYMCDDGEYICDVRPWDKGECIFTTCLEGMHLRRKRIINDKIVSNEN